MAIEIERKFLVRNDSWKQAADAGTPMIQGYMLGDGLASVRVRLEGEEARLNIKSRTLGVRRQEYEYPIPVDDAREMLDTLCSNTVSKVRYRVVHAGMTWEVDVFEGDNAGLIVAEIELASEDQEFAHPDWLGKEVSDDERYYNTCLASHPYREWAANAS